MKTIVLIGVTILMAGMSSWAETNNPPIAASAPTAPQVEKPRTPNNSSGSISHISTAQTSQTGAMHRAEAQGLLTPSTNRGNLGGTIETVIGSRNNDVFTIVFPQAQPIGKNK